MIIVMSLLDAWQNAEIVVNPNKRTHTDKVVAIGECCSYDVRLGDIRIWTRN